MRRDRHRPVRREVRPALPAPSHPGGAQLPEPDVLLQRFLQAMRMRNCSERTMEVWLINARRFLRWCQDRGLSCVSQIDAATLCAYRRYLFYYRQKHSEKPLRFSTQLAYLIPVKRWFEWLASEGWKESDVTLELEMPKEEQRLPLGALSVEEVERVLNGTDPSKPCGVRDRAMLETLYSTALRRSELVELEVYDLDQTREQVVVRQGKGRKDRVVPIGRRALSWVRKYVADVRPALIVETHETRLFVTKSGAPFVRNNLSALVKGYFLKAGISRRGSCHLMRHTAATLMLENGADLRSLQLYLGHQRLNTTQIYTHVSIERLKEVHRRTHPAQLPAPDTDASERPDGAAQSD